MSERVYVCECMCACARTRVPAYVRIIVCMYHCMYEMCIRDRCIKCARAQIKIVKERVSYFINAIENFVYDYLTM